MPVASQSVVNCNNCGVSITDPDFRVVLIQEDYPDIEIGPYCEQCMGKIKICSGCQKPHLGSECKGDNNGDFFCPTCHANLTTCDSCGNICSESSRTYVNNTGKGSPGHVCQKCFNRDFFKCDCCDTVHHLYQEKDKFSRDAFERPGVFKKYKRICTTCFESKKNAFKKYEVSTCKNCGDHYAVKSTSHNKYCERCYPNIPTCQICGEKDHRIISLRVRLKADKNLIRSKGVCQSCLSKLTKCCCCGVATDSTVVSYVKGSVRTHKVCGFCETAKECANCGKLHLPSEAEGGKYCDTCMSYLFNNICSECSRIKDRDFRCRVCDDRGIYSYSYKHPLRFNYLESKENRGDTLFFGFENEVTFGHNGEPKRRKALKVLYETYDCSILTAKSDGSISGYGYEIVSQPMSLLYFSKMDLSTLLPSTLIKDSSCGLHIHVGRQSFVSEVHLYKVINFLRDNPKFTTHVAGRGRNGYSCDIEKKVPRYLKDSKNGNTERRCMVNLTNKDTVEFRLFAGCVTDFELRSRFEVLHALIEFCKYASISEAKSIENFVKFVNSNIKLYTNAAALVSTYQS